MLESKNSERQEWWGLCNWVTCIYQCRIITARLVCRQFDLAKIFIVLHPAAATAAVLVNTNGHSASNKWKYPVDITAPIWHYLAVLSVFLQWFPSFDLVRSLAHSLPRSNNAADRLIATENTLMNERFIYIQGDDKADARDSWSPTSVLLFEC